MIPPIISQENNIYIITIIVSHDQIIIIPDIADKMPIVEGMEHYLLSEIFIFKPNCKLKRFIEKYTNTEIHNFTMMNIINKLNYITKTQGMHDVNNPSLIICTPEMEDALNVKGLHSLELLSAVVEHILSDTQPPMYSNFARHPSANYRISTSAQIDMEGRVTQHQSIMQEHIANSKYYLQRNLQKLLNLDETAHTMEKALEALTKYISTSQTIEIDERNPKIAFIANDPLGDLLNMKALHTSQKQHIISYFMTTDLNQKTAYEQYQQILIEESIQFMSYVYLTANASAILLNSGLQLDRTNCPHFFAMPEYENIDEFEIPSAEETTRPAQAMGRTEHLSSADDTDTTGELNIPTYAQRLDALLTSESEQSLSENCNYSNVTKETTRRHSSISDDEKETCDSIKLIFSALKNAVIYGDVSSKVTFTEREQINISLKIPKHVDVDFPTEETERNNDETRKDFLSTIHKLVKETLPINGKAKDSNNHKQIEKLRHLKETILRWNSENQHALSQIERVIKEQHNTPTCTSKRDSIMNIRSQNRKVSTSEEIINHQTCTPNLIQTTKPNILDQNCINCHKKNFTKLPRCNDCWNIRKQWIPERPKKRKRANPERTQQISNNKTSTECRTEMEEDEDNTPSTSSETKAEVQSPKQPNLDDTMEEKCWCCVSRNRNALIIHGKQGHRLLCYPCAKKTWNTKGECPICKRKIEKIVKIIDV